jgi:AcrR family transcriptional regulator
MEPTERRRELLLAAKKVFADKGYHAAGVADIVDAAAVARGTFYLYFKSKRDVFAAVLDYIFQSLMEQLQSIPLDQPEQILKGIMDNFALVEAFFEQDSEHAQIIIREAMFLDDASSQRVDEMRQALVEYLRNVVTQWQEAGILRPLDPELVAHAFVGAWRSFFEQRVILGKLAASGEEILENLIQLFLFGLISPEHFELAADHLRDIGGEDA